MTPIAVALAIVLIQAGESPARSYRFIASGDLPHECTPSDVSVAENRDLIVRAFGEKNWIDFLSFQGRLAGAVGIELYPKQATESDVTQIWVLSESKEHCETARANFSAVLDDISQTRLRKMEPMADRKPSKGNTIFDMVCTQHRKRDRSIETTCAVRKNCKTIQIKNDDPMLPLNLTLPCKTTDLSVR